MLGIETGKLAVDLGTVHTRIAVAHKGIVLREPTVAAVSRESAQDIIAVGNEAIEKFANSPSSIDLRYPIRRGVICDTWILSAMLHRFVEKALGRRLLAFGVKMVLTSPLCMNDVERHALCEAARHAGGRSVRLIPAPLAAAVGAEVPIHGGTGRLVVDIGGGKTDAAVIAFGDIVASKSIREGGMSMDHAINAHIRRKYGVMIGSRMSERIKLKACAEDGKGNDAFSVCGRNTRTGLPETISLKLEEARFAMRSGFYKIVDMVLELLETLPPELAGDLIDNGITLTGGSSNVKELNALMEKRSGLKAKADENAPDCAILGALFELTRKGSYAQSEMEYAPLPQMGFNAY